MNKLHNLESPNCRLGGESQNPLLGGVGVNLLREMGTHFLDPLCLKTIFKINFYIHDNIETM